MEKLNLLRGVLKRRFPKEKVNALAVMLSLASEKGIISYEEVECDEETKQNLLLLAYKERLLMPVSASKMPLSLAWEGRTFTAKRGEKYEMPNVIRHLISYAMETGEWNPEVAVRKYLKEISEVEMEEMVKVFKEIREEAKESGMMKVTPSFIKQICERNKLKIDLNKLIVEFKGGGIISPCPLKFSKNEVIYEVNPSLV